MAARSVSPGYLLCAAVLTVAAAAATFHLKYATRTLDQQIDRARQAIEERRWAIQAVRADLAFLTRPERLVLQAGQLGLVPGRGDRLVQADRIPELAHLELAKLRVNAMLPSGASVPFRRAAAADGPGPHGDRAMMPLHRLGRRPQTNPMLRLGRVRVRVVMAVFAMAFSSIGLRLFDMVEWGVPGDLPQAVLAPPAQAALTAEADDFLGRADIVDRNGSPARHQPSRAVGLSPIRHCWSTDRVPRPPGLVLPAWRRRAERRLIEGRRFAWVKHRGDARSSRRRCWGWASPASASEYSRQRVYPQREPDRPCRRLCRHRQSAAWPGSSTPCRTGWSAGRRRARIRWR